MNLPELSPEPEIITYDDSSFAINWWPHQIYRQKYDELFDHEEYALGEEGEYYHKGYVEGELKVKKTFEQNIQKMSLL